MLGLPTHLGRFPHAVPILGTDRFDLQRRPFMAKKSAAPASEAPATAEATKSDPTLLGVGLPVTVTLEAAKTVFTAWKASFLALKSAVEEKLKKKDVAPEATPAVDGPVATA